MAYALKIEPSGILKGGNHKRIDLLSRANLKISMVEISVPYESQIEQSHEYKTSEYEDL